MVLVLYNNYGENNQTSLDIAPYIATGGITWKREDADGPGTGRVMSGELFRQRLAIKHRIDVTLIPLPMSLLSPILKAIKPVFIHARYTDPEEGDVVLRRVYSNNIPAKILLSDVQNSSLNGVDEELWGGVTFPLIEK